MFVAADTSSQITYVNATENKKDETVVELLSNLYVEKEEYWTQLTCDNGFSGTIATSVSYRVAEKLKVDPETLPKIHMRFISKWPHRANTGIESNNS